MGALCEILDMNVFNVCFKGIKEGFWGFVGEEDIAEMRSKENYYLSLRELL